jgi:uncharacterized membrane-anchored protein YjiN (DUF445 family)
MNDIKRARLRQMQRLNLALLGASLVLLTASVRYQALWPWLRWLQAFAEASAIGAIADWYAVVALFRRPLGLPIPHTAIIPRNQRKIADSLGTFVAQYLLTPDTIVAKLERFETARHLAGWFVVPANAAAFADALTGLLPALLRAPDDADLRRLFRTAVVPRLLALDAARVTQKFIELLLDTRLHSALLDRALILLDGWLIENEALIRDKFAQASKYTPAFVDGYIVRKFLEGVRALIHDVGVDSAHPLRESFETTLRDWSRALVESAEQREAAQSWLRGAVAAFAGDQDLQRLREALATRAEADLARPDSVLRHSAAALIVALAQGVARDRAIVQRLEGSWLRFVRTAAARHGGQISALIAEVVKGWDADEVSRKIELEIGPDLQFIRINGALVGGIVGLVLYAGTVMVGR